MRFRFNELTCTCLLTYKNSYWLDSRSCICQLYIRASLCEMIRLSDTTCWSGQSEIPRLLATKCFLHLSL